MIFHIWWILAFLAWIAGNYLLAGFLISIKWMFNGYGWNAFGIVFRSEVRAFEVWPLTLTLILGEVIVIVLMMLGVHIRF